MTAGGPTASKGVAALADAPVDHRRVARIMAGTAVVVAGLALATAEGLEGTADAPPRGLRELQALALDPQPGTDLRPPGSAARVWIPEGLPRVGEAPLAEALHALLTGAPAAATGVRAHLRGRPRLVSLLDGLGERGGRVEVEGAGAQATALRRWLEDAGAPLDETPGGPRLRLRVGGATEDADLVLERAAGGWRTGGPNGGHPPERGTTEVARRLGVPAPPAAVEATGPHDLVRAGLARALADRAAARARRIGIERRGWVYLLPFVLLVLALGPIKRAFGFDRGLAAAMLGFVAIEGGAAGLLFALAPPRGLGFDVGSGLLGALAAAVAIGGALPLARRPHAARRLAAGVGWASLAVGFGALTWVSFAFGPWPVAPATRDGVRLALLAGAGALGVVAATLVVAREAVSSP